MLTTQNKISINLWHTISMNINQNFRDNTNIAKQSLQMSQQHYENFPVASILLPSKLRKPIGLIYSFARQADDFADEGDLSIEERLRLLQNFRDELDLIRAYIKPKTPFFETLGVMIRAKGLPLDAFYDLLDAFSQDIVKTRYANYEELLDYCKRSANPVGRLMLHLYGMATSSNIKLSDNICSALQLINFLQDIAIDIQKNEGKSRIYLCQDEMQTFNISETQIINGNADERWQTFMQFNIQRTRLLLNSGKPLGRILKGRIGLEMRLIIAGGERILDKLDYVHGDVFAHRPTLNKLDWLVMIAQALKL